ncbi:hypothetical protein G9A89_013365 [Geosiphon pyriformis]|nr:hypothetical protein G9A89_013365 [Geosiphon pyriformis]
MNGFHGKGLSIIDEIATLVGGLILNGSIKHHGLIEYEKGKTTYSGEEMILNIELSMFDKKGRHLENISQMYEITQNAETLEYGIVMDFAKHGDMRKYLSTNFHSTNWKFKLSIAWNITCRLDNIHSSGMVHCDLHSGNILQLNQELVNIGDLGLSQPVNHEATTTEEKEGIFGVIPYIPPEVLRGEKFTSAGDIYSFSMLLWELATGMPPFHDLPHDLNLIFDIIFKGIRPEITSPLIPPCISEIIERCWDDNPLNRPTTKEIGRMLSTMYARLIKEKFVNEKSKTMSPETIQFKESDECVKEMVKNDSRINYSTTTSIHSGAIYTSRLLSLQIFEETQDD